MISNIFFLRRNNGAMNRRSKEKEDLKKIAVSMVMHG